MSIDTKERLLDTAERLFAENGVATTSLRDLTTAASANLASVNYHFGTKEALLTAVFDRRLGPVNGRRLQLLDEVEGAAASPRLEDILWAFLAPPFHAMVHWGEAGRRFMRLVGRIMADPARSTSETFVAQFAGVRERFLVAFGRALPELGEEEVERRTHFVLGAMAHTFIWCEHVCCLDPSADAGNTDAVLQSLIRFAAAGLTSSVEPVVPTVSSTAAVLS